MKQALFILCLLTTGLSAQTTTDDYFRARQGYRAGGTNSQLITGFDLSFPGTPTNTKLPTTKAVSDYLNANVLFYGGSSGGDLSGAWPTPRVAEIQDFPVSATDPTEGQVWQLVSGVWTPSTLSTGATYTAGSGIAISGGNEISNTAPNVVQVLGLASNTLSLTNGGGSVDLSPYVNVAAQTLSYSAPNLTISGGNSVDISGNNYWSKATNDLYYTAGKVGIGLSSGFGAGLHVATNSALSTPGIWYSGTWITGGTTTTNKPAVLVEPTGTTSTAWSTAGTALGINAPSGFAGNLFDAKVNGVTAFTLSSFGTLTSTAHLYSGGNVRAIASGDFHWLTRSRIKSFSDGVITLYNDATGDFNRLQFGGTTSAFPALKRVTTGIAVRLADDSADAPISASTGTFSTKVVVGTTSAPAASSALDIVSTTGGLLPPRMTTTQRDAISSPAEGLIIYNLTAHKLNVYTGSAWETITSL